MSIFLKLNTPGPTLDVEQLTNMSTEAILQLLEDEGIHVYNDEGIQYSWLTRDRPTAKLDQRSYVPTAPVIRTSTVLQGLQDADADSYLEAMAALARYLNQEEAGPDTLFFTLLAIDKPQPAGEPERSHIYCAVRRFRTQVSLEFFLSLPVDWQQGHKIKGSDMILVGFKKAVPKPIFS